ncbi:MAG: hypothetical protein LBL74_03625 [Bacteroidales bacterium]|jgi:hypothetical protein|nr:hypothetical protein [Bacteroidales bacterium]
MAKQADNINKPNFNISIIRISTLLQGFMLANQINKTLPFKFHKEENFDRMHECFVFYSSCHRILMLLIGNNAFDNSQRLIKAFDNEDYLFAIIGRNHQSIGEQFLSCISSVRDINPLNSYLVFPPQNQANTVSDKLLLKLIEYKEDVLGILE